MKCAAPPSGEDTCFFGVEVDFAQVCSPACYWGGLCNAAHCIKQRNECIVFCPTGFACSYGYCVKEELMPLFLQNLMPYLYSKNALIQPSDPNTPLVLGDGTSNAAGPVASTGTTTASGSSPVATTSVLLTGFLLWMGARLAWN
jgi:hypothetical protein